MVFQDYIWFSLYIVTAILILQNYVKVGISKKENEKRRKLRLTLCVKERERRGVIERKIEEERERERQRERERERERREKGREREREILGVWHLANHAKHPIVSKKLRNRILS
jgi:hypothetical protein